MKRILCILAAGLTISALSGCVAGLSNDFASTNELIARENTDRYKAFTEAMVACGSNAACQVGVSMGLATNAGASKYIQPERTAEVLGAIVPFGSLLLQGIDLFYGGGPTGFGSSGYVVTGDNNTFSGVGNNLEASGGSTVTAPFTSSNTFSWDHNNRDYNLGGTAGTIDDTGIVDTYPESTDTGEVVVTED